MGPKEKWWEAEEEGGRGVGGEGSGGGGELQTESGVLKTTLRAEEESWEEQGAGSIPEFREL